MSISVKHFFNFLNSFSPLKIAEENDNNGLQVGSYEAEVKGVLLSIDPSKKAVSYAIKNNLNLILTHHPLIYPSLKKIIKEDLIGEILHLLIQNHLNLISWHTPLDKIEDGVSEALLRVLKLENFDFITKEIVEGKVYGIGKVAEVYPPLTVKELAERIKEITQSWVVIVGKPEEKINKVGICGGSGSFLKDTLRKRGINTLITADVKYHVAKIAEEEGFNFIIIDHGISESFVLEILKEKIEKFLQENKLDIPIKIFKEESPYKIL
ncbi:MAG: Nif3-like dinuclear metal center hexameric protein [Thermodesulfobacteriaceae bacterium]|nr:Nif3-like dinuclear metal center hexameric protein [Thermodesulfobacteriaceae bacterium]MDW8136352.1 Nif3-like dinuclear metal center hexameric protein [Thermodesulfobacterium sp.]